MGKDFKNTIVEPFYKKNSPKTLGRLSGEAELQRIINVKVRGDIDGRNPMASFPPQPANIKPECDWQLLEH